MNVFDRRAALKLLGAIPIFLHEGLWNSADAEPLVNPGTVDWSQAVIENMMTLKPDPASLGIWVLAIGAARYAFLAAGWLLPWMREPLPPRHWRKVVTATV